MAEEDIASKLDPREVLAYLNEMGIRNISGEKLKEFMCDLKKLIRYDIQCKYGQGDTNEATVADSKSVQKGPERLHSCSTVSSRSKCVKNSQPRKPFSCLKNTCPPPPRVQIDTAIKKERVDKLSDVQPRIQRRCLSATTIDNPPNSIKSAEAKTMNIRKSNNNFIRVPIVEKPKKSDPVSLYHSYSTLWAKYKNNFPGENSWADVRWSVRERLLGVKPATSSTKVQSVSQETLAKRRDGWLD